MKYPDHDQTKDVQLSSGAVLLKADKVPEFGNKFQAPAWNLDLSPELQQHLEALISVVTIAGGSATLLERVNRAHAGCHSRDFRLSVALAFRALAIAAALEASNAAQLDQVADN